MAVGTLRIRVLETPGHTPESICLVVVDQKKSADAWAVLTGDTLCVTRQKHRGSANVSALLSHRLGAAEHHIIDQRGVERRTSRQRAQHLCAELHRRHFVQGAIGAAAAARSTHMVIDQGIGHGVLAMVCLLEGQGRR